MLHNYVEELTHFKPTSSMVIPLVLIYVLKSSQGVLASNNTGEPELEPQDITVVSSSDVHADPTMASASTTTLAAPPSASPTICPDSLPSSSGVAANASLSQIKQSGSILHTTGLTRPFSSNLPLRSNSTVPPDANTAWIKNLLAAKYMGSLAVLYIAICLYMALKSKTLYDH